MKFLKLNYYKFCLLIINILIIFFLYLLCIGYFDYINMSTDDGWKHGKPLENMVLCVIIVAKN